MTDSLSQARGAVDAAAGVVEVAARKLAQASVTDGRLSVSKFDQHQVLAYDLAHAAAAVEAGRVMLDYAQQGDIEARLAFAFIADSIAELATKLVGRADVWGSDGMALQSAADFVTQYRSPEFLAALGDDVAKHGTGPTHLDDDFSLVADTFRRFAEEVVRPHAEHVHRSNGDVPEEIIAGLAEIGGFGLSVPEEYGGFATGGESDYMGMVVSTEELSRGSLGIGGSLITRPEILTRAVVAGGTEDQKQTWLPRIATGELMAGIMVTEPDFGSDVQGLKVTATPVDGGYVINGVKTWCTFAGRATILLVLARTNTDRTLGGKGLSAFLVEKPKASGHHFEFTQDTGGKLEGRAIDTLGYRGMHSYEVSFDNWFVPSANLVGEEAGLGRGFYLQMAGF